ncbi:phage tail protein [Bradyrhizobium sp. CSA112]|uniref:phage tail protein n=1 Tax=Bradyrhizobium sp. CSA112 TaxID=2699170 RepID=UPI0023B18307|nr:tail fiber protein [Bradyrhizobium sp. CSA112]MDE5451339.1 phage tail protein [Bradyrhizobium sp. CSA112]
MALQHYLWSRTAASNATADPSVNWQEGQAPSSVNDSARAMMASAAGFRDDISGAIATGGTSTAYTVASYQVFNSLANMSGQMIAFTPHATNGATVTLNVDGLGAMPLRSAPSVELPAGVLVQGSPYIALYNSSDSVFYLHGYYVNPYSIPIAGGIDYWGTTAPNSSFAFPAGQAISRTTYSTLFAIIGTAYGVGDGSTTFNLPDKTGRVSAMKESSATRLTSAYFGASGATLGATGGSESNTLSLAKIPTGIQSTNNGSIALTVTTTQKVVNGPNGGSAQAGGTQVTAADPGSGGALSLLASTGTLAVGDVDVTSINTSGEPHANVQPTIVCNYIMRII